MLFNSWNWSLLVCPSRSWRASTLTHTSMTGWSVTECIWRSPSLHRIYLGVHARIKLLFNFQDSSLLQEWLSRCLPTLPLPLPQTTGLVVSGSIPAILWLRSFRQSCSSHATQWFCCLHSAQSFYLCVVHPALYAICSSAELRMYSQIPLRTTGHMEKVKRWFL